MFRKPYHYHVAMLLCANLLVYGQEPLAERIDFLKHALAFFAQNNLAPKTENTPFLIDLHQALACSYDNIHQRFEQEHKTYKKNKFFLDNPNEKNDLPNFTAQLSHTLKQIRQDSTQLAALKKNELASLHDFYTSSDDKKPKTLEHANELAQTMAKENKIKQRIILNTALANNLNEKITELQQFEASKNDAVKALDSVKVLAVALSLLTSEEHKTQTKQLFNAINLQYHPDRNKDITKIESEVFVKNIRDILKDTDTAIKNTVSIIEKELSHVATHVTQPSLAKMVGPLATDLLLPTVSYIVSYNTMLKLLPNKREENKYAQQCRNSFAETALKIELALTKTMNHRKGTL